MILRPLRHWPTKLLEPPLTNSADQVHRLLIDRTKRVVTSATRLWSTASRVDVRLTFRSSGINDGTEKRLGDDGPLWTSLPWAKFPAPQTIRSGEVLQLNLLANDNWVSS